ncbi:DUF6188 family protein [uncultured Modestobacter sp.]|uniref:DUF6188 family protein n=1 Tax=uncultured Modestobacter sp. TaxID=380048 RepID=UPI00260DBA49|nr:DUF6188 family protein [uncultured Modestobacter sp.]
MTADGGRSASAQVQPLVGRSLSQLCVGPHDAQLRFSGAVTVTFEAPITVASAPGEPVLAHELEGLALLVPLLNGDVVAVAVGDDGALGLTIGGTTLRCGPDPDHEAWQVTGSDVGLVVCGPGGGLDVWHS